MVMQLQLEVFGEVELDRQLLRFSQAAEDMRPAYQLIHQDFLATELHQFDEEGAGPSGKWAPLAESTMVAKALADLPDNILVSSGALRASLTEEGDENHVYYVSGDSLVMGSTVDYGKYHQSRLPRTKLPRRPPIDLTERTKKYWVKIIQRHLVEAFRAGRAST